tara:strand:+ start:10320 stop:10529 length:210 start_codon:yes stop_codon:yes gene_type:complete
MLGICPNRCGLSNTVTLPLSINILDRVSGLSQTFINTSSFVKGYIHPVIGTLVNAISFYYKYPWVYLFL